MKLYDAGPERYNYVPVRVDDSQPRRVFMLEVPRSAVGGLWHICVELHVTNDDLRNRGKGVACVTEVRIQDHTQNVRDGLALFRANGSWNVGVEAHHALICRSKWIEWTPYLIEQAPNSTAPLYLTFFVMAKSTAAIDPDRLIVTPGRGFMQLVIYGNEA